MSTIKSMYMCMMMGMATMQMLSLFDAQNCI